MFTVEYIYKFLHKIYTRSFRDPFVLLVLEVFKNSFYHDPFQAIQLDLSHAFILFFFAQKRLSRTPL